MFVGSIVDETDTLSSSISESLSFLFLLDVGIWAGYFHDAWHDDRMRILRNMASRTSLFTNKREKE